MEKEKKTTIVDSWKDEVRRDVRRAATLFYFLVGDVCLIVALVAAIKGHELKGLLMMIIALGWLILARLDGIVPGTKIEYRLTEEEKNVVMTGRRKE